jgi:lipopolysaccharide transport protein LptA
MKRYLHIYIIVTFLLCAGATVIFALEAREVGTRLNASGVRITVGDSQETINLKGPIDFWHEDRHIKGGDSVLTLQYDSQTAERVPIFLKVNSGVVYDDLEGYKVQCGRADYDFRSGVANFISNIKLTGKDMAFTADKIELDTKLETLDASGNVTHEGTTRQTLLVRSDSKSPAGKSGVPDSKYFVTCNQVHMDKAKNLVEADGSVTFKIETTQILADSVDIKSKDNEITEITATGNITFTDPDMRGTAWSAIYSKDKETLILKGNPNGDPVDVVYKGQKLKGRSVTVNLSNGRELILDGGKISIKPEE